MMSVKSLETLEVWKKSKEFAVRIYREALPLLPPEEKWNLNQQLRRASTSIPANIAEGYGRFYYQEIIRFCYIARGSLEETLIGYLKRNKQGQNEPGANQAVREDIAPYNADSTEDSTTIE
jgi:four helix bundle protein